MNHPDWFKFVLFSGSRPVRNRNHVPKSDGCGSLGFQIASEYLPLEEMTKCCDSHDICYDTCNSGKEVCDLDFKRCLYNYCDSYKSVNVAGDTITKGTLKSLIRNRRVHFFDNNRNDDRAWNLEIY